ncbi:hypothetical protein OGAPHI_006535 [Ogataea philodendri]|uniref:Uncharacterized protein n=1 Tax=Ogataea philodendri TaxID=1378263 RepID=A0A9P8T185_9ASCO|nr:uncharacterized protein OGAPHI_006535 [Ogataea philodendri]KAH3661685.1 hypothetical protein OGAPHI_006535 [Ogataea philodendri]
MHSRYSTSFTRSTYSRAKFIAIRASPQIEHLDSTATGRFVSYLNIFKLARFVVGSGDDGADCVCAAFQASVDALSGSITTLDSKRLVTNDFFWKNLTDGDRSSRSTGSISSVTRCL